MALNRPLNAPLQGHRVRTAPAGAADTWALFRTTEAAAGNGMVDAAGGATLTDLNSVGVADGLFDADGDGKGSRTFNGTTQRQFRTASAGDIANFVRTAGTPTGVTVAFWMKLAAFSGVNMCLFEIGGVDAGAETQTGNKLLKIRLNGAQHIELFWEQGVGVDVTADMNAIANVAEVCHIGVTLDCDPSDVSKTRARVWKNGVLIKTTLGLVNANGGSLASELSIGASNLNGALTEFYNGTLCDLVVEKWAAEDDWHMEQYARGIRDWDEGVLHQARAFQVVQRAFVQDTDLVWRDLTSLFGRNHLVGTMCHDGTDQPGMTAEVLLKRQSYGFNLSPKMTGSPINKDAALATIEFLQSRRRIKIQRAVIPMGRTPASWMYRTRFDGFIDTIKYQDDPMVLMCRGLELALQDVFILDETDMSTIYVTRLLEVQLQALIDLFRPGTGLNPSPTPNYKGEDNATITPFKVFCPTSPAWVLGIYFQATKKIWEAMQALVEQIGFRLSMRWDDHRQCFRPTVYQPDRTKSAIDRTVSPYEIIDVKKLEHSASEVRNKVRVRLPAEAATNDPGNATGGVLDITVTDSTSIAKYGLLACSIGEASNANVNTAAEGTTLANAALNDMKEPLAVAEVEMRYQQWPEVEDMIRFSRDDRRWDSNLDLAIQSFDDEVRGDNARSTFALRAKPQARSNRHWGGRLIDPISHPFRSRTPFAIPAAPTLLAIANGIVVTWAQPDGIIGIGKKYDVTEVHMSATPGFTITAGTLVAICRDRCSIPIQKMGAATRYIKIVHRDTRGNRSVSAEASTVPRYLPYMPGGQWFRAADYDPGAGKTTLILNGVNVDNFNNLVTGTGIFTAPVDALYVAGVGVRFTDTVNSTVSVELQHSRYGIIGPGAAVGPALSGNPFFHSPVFKLIAGDTLRATVNVTVHGSANFRIKSDPNTFLDITHIGPY